MIVSNYNKLYDGIQYTRDDIAKAVGSILKYPPNSVRRMSDDSTMQTIPKV